MIKATVAVPGFGPMREIALDKAARIRALLGEGFQVVVPDGKNIAQARNRALEEAEGEFIAWVDADDEVGEAWADVVREATDCGADVTVFDGIAMNRINDHAFVWGADPEKTTPEYVLRDNLRDFLTSHLPMRITRTALWDGLRFDETLSRMEDFMIFPHVLRRARTARYIPKRVYGYTYRDDSLTHTPDADISRSILHCAFRRAEEWKDTQYREDAETGTASIALDCLECFAIDGRLASAPGADEIKEEARRWLADRKKNLLSRTARFRDRLKLRLAVAGIWWPRRLYWRLRGVRLRKTCTG